MKGALEERHHVLAERELLLTELHHRVKNNAQATTSLLALQASRAADPAVAAALRGAAARVMLASGVQDRMFRRAADRAGVDLGAEIAAAAAAALEAMRGVGEWDAPGAAVVLETRCEAGLRVPVARATSLVLAVSELVVNAARHAFPEGRRGRIAVSLRPRRGAAGEGEIRVEDDGTGLPEGLDREAPQHGLGLHLSHRLARQAGARLRLEGPPGTTAVIAFRLP